MKYDFDEIIDRRNTASSKWDNVGARVGNAKALPMWVADTDFKCPQPVIEAVIKRVEHGIYGYPFRDGQFAKVTKDWLWKRHGWNIAENWVTFSPGVVPSLNTIVQAVTLPGDEVIIQRPVYYPFSQAIADNERVISSNSLKLRDGHYEIDFEDLERRAQSKKAKLMILCNPHNPVCRVYTKEELLKIGEICLKNNVLLVSDEIHSDIVYQSYKHVPVASLSKEIANITFTAVAPSKTFNIAGLRASALVVSNQERMKVLEKQFGKNRSSILSVFGLTAYIAAYSQCEDYLEQMLPYLQNNIDYLDKFLKEQMPKIKLIKPEGTYLLWLDCRELDLTKEELDDFFINKSLVAVDKGYWFGDEGEGFMRINVACPLTTVKQALEQLYGQYTKL
jgi:cystathionine beta-lyase